MDPTLFLFALIMFQIIIMHIVSTTVSWLLMRSPVRNIRDLTGLSIIFLLPVPECDVFHPSERRLLENVVPHLSGGLPFVIIFIIEG